MWRGNQCGHSLVESMVATGLAAVLALVVMHFFGAMQDDARTFAASQNVERDAEEIRYLFTRQFKMKLASSPSTPSTVLPGSASFYVPRPGPGASNRRVSFATFCVGAGGTATGGIAAFGCDICGTGRKAVIRYKIDDNTLKQWPSPHVGKEGAAAGALCLTKDARDNVTVTLKFSDGPTSARKKSYQKGFILSGARPSVSGIEYLP